MSAPRHEIEFLPAVLEIQERPPSPLGRAILWAVILLFVLAVAWAALGKVDIVAVAAGKTVPAGRTKVIQPADLGVIRALHVTEGQKVSAGDLLIELDPTIDQAELARLAGQRRDARLAKLRLATLLDWLEQGPPEPLPDPEALFKGVSEPVSADEMQVQYRLLLAEWRGFAESQAALDQERAVREGERAGVRENIAKLEETLPIVTRRARALETVANRKLVPEMRWLELEQRRIETERDLAALRERYRSLGAAIAETEARQRAGRAEFRRDLLDRLAEIRARIATLDQEIAKAENRTGRQRLRSPIDGIVQELVVHTIGGVVTPAQTLMKIVPRSHALEIEAWIENKDIGFVHEGQSVEIKVKTFPFTRYGTLEGVITDVSDDAVTDEDKGLVHAARVRLVSDSMHIDGRELHLTPGMAVTVEVKTGERRLIEFLLSPLLRYRKESLRER